jgi:hypothetical protein
MTRMLSWMSTPVVWRLRTQIPFGNDNQRGLAQA